MIFMSDIDAVTGPYSFTGGFPDEQTIQRAYDDADLNRAVQAYRFFFPTVSGAAMFRGNEQVGVYLNKSFGVLDTQPRQVGFTLNSDTPYGPVGLDLRPGPLVVELPPGPLLGAAMDINQRWIADLGVPGPDAGNGGKHLLLPPGWDGDVPDGYFVARATSYRVIVGVRSLPVGGDMAGANERLQTIVVHPLDPDQDWTPPTWVDFTDLDQDITPLTWETNLGYWRALHQVVDTEPHLEAFGPLYGELAVLGIAKGRPFEPDERQTRILEQAAVLGSGQMRVQAFADRRPDRVVWDDSQWQWAGLRPENGDFYTPDYLDVDAREKWFYQAIAASPAMFRRQEGAGSLYWLGLRDSTGSYLDGSRAYRLLVPQPVPARLFWSITVYDAETRSQIATDQNRAALRSLFELADVDPDRPVELRFGPDRGDGFEGRWIQTIPGKGWFVYFRIYGPQGPAFNGDWALPDFQQV